MIFRFHIVFKSKLDNLILEVKDTQEVVKFNTTRIISLETAFHDKIGVLFDSHSINSDEHKEFKSSIHNLDSKVFNLDARASILESKTLPDVASEV